MAKKSSSKRMRKVQESDTGSEGDLFMEEDTEMLNFAENEGKGYGFDDESDELEQEEEEDDDDEDNNEGDEEEMHEAENEDRNNAEIEELEKEYMGLRHEEQDLLKNLKRQKDEDLLKGQAVKNQKALWDKTLEFRFLLQKAFSSSNRLPQEPIRSSFCESDDETSVAYSDLITSSKKTLDSILELQEALVEKNPSITQGPDGISKACGAVIVNRADELQESDVGTGAGLFEVKKIGDEFFASIVECKDPKACNVLLRGASKDLLNEVERNLQDAMSVARNIIKNPKLVPGGGATELSVSATLKILKKWPYEAAAVAFEAIPRTLAQNCGVK